MRFCNFFRTQAVSQFHHRSSKPPTLGPRKTVELETIAQIANRARRKLIKPQITNHPTTQEPESGSKEGNPKRPHLGKGERTPENFDGSALQKTGAQNADGMMGATVKNTEVAEKPRSKVGGLASLMLKRKRACLEVEDERRGEKNRRGERTKRTKLGKKSPKPLHAGEEMKQGEKEGGPSTTNQDSRISDGEKKKHENIKLVETNSPKPGARAQVFERQVWDTSRKHFVVKKGRVLEGPLPSTRVTRQSVYRIKYEDGQEEYVGLRSAQISYKKAEASDAVIETERKNGNRAEGSGAGESDSSKNHDNKTAEGALTRKLSKAAEEMRTPPVQKTHKQDDRQNVKRPGSWRPIEVDWFLERLCALYGPTRKGFQEAWRDYEASTLPEGVTIEHKPRKSSDRVDKYYIYTADPSKPVQTYRFDSLVKLQQFLDEMSSGEFISKEHARAHCRAVASARGPSTLSPEEKKMVKERMDVERWSIVKRQRQAGASAGG
jgi:hypothetical protein